jgi:flagellar biosynthesis protein FlhA
LIPGLMKLGEVQQVLQMLLREGLSIRRLGPILETLGDWGPRTKDPVVLTEHVRQRFARVLCSRYRDSDNRLHVVTLDPALEEQIRTGAEQTGDGISIRLSPHEVDGICSAIRAEIEHLETMGRPPIILVSRQIRPAVKQLTATYIPQLIVLSYSEITRDTRVESAGMVAGALDEQTVAAA